MTYWRTIEKYPLTQLDPSAEAKEVESMFSTAISFVNNTIELIRVKTLICSHNTMLSDISAM